MRKKAKFTRVLMATDESSGSTRVDGACDGHKIIEGSRFARCTYPGVHAPRGDCRGAQHRLHTAKEATRNGSFLGENG